MGKITKGFKYIGAGIVDLLAGGVKLFEFKKAMDTKEV